MPRQKAAPLSAALQLFCVTNAEETQARRSDNVGTAPDNKQRSPAQRGEWLGLSVRSAAKPKGSSGAPAPGFCSPTRKLCWEQHYST